MTVTSDQLYGALYNIGTEFDFDNDANPSDEVVAKLIECGMVELEIKLPVLTEYGRMCFEILDNSTDPVPYIDDIRNQELLDAAIIPTPVEA